MNREKYNKIIQEKFNNNIEISKNMPKDFDYKYSNKEKIEFTCIKHGTFYKTYDNISKSVYGCNKCAKERSKETISKINKKPKRKGKLTIKELEIEIQKRFGDKIKLINTEKNIEIKNLKEKMTFECIEHGLFEKTVENLFKSRHGCNSCGYSNSNKDRIVKYSINEVQAILDSKFKNIFITKNNPSDNIRLNDLLEFKCEYHGTFEKTLQNIVVQKHGCNICSKKAKSSNKKQKTKKNKKKKRIKYNKDFIIKTLNKKFDGNITLVENQNLDDIKGEKTLKFHCKKHGDFENKIINVIKSKYGCIQCYKSSNLDYWNKKINEKFDGKIEIDNNKHSYYINKNSTLTFNCKEHGKFKNKISNVIKSKYGCLECSIEGRKNTNLEKHGHSCNLYADGVQESIKEKHLKKYGVDNPLKSKEVQEKIKQTNLKKYGYANPAQSETIKQKMKQTNLERYGKEYYSQTDEYIERVTKFYNNKYGYDWNFQSPEIIEQIKKTNKDRYGYEYASQSPIIKDKIKNKNLEKYGVEHTFKLPYIQEKIRKSNLKRYGVENPFASKEIQEKIKQTNVKRYGSENPNHNREVREKIEQTNLIKYGFKNPMQNENVVSKVIKTKRENNTFNTSKPQEKMKEELLKIYPDLKTEYNKDERYPFCCDFYIPSRDLFIELNGFWTHGGHWFNKNNKKDLEKLKKRKNKNKESYNNAIKTWTISDPLKKETAIINNLNYIVFWDNDLKDFYKWIECGIPLIY